MAVGWDKNNAILGAEIFELHDLVFKIQYFKLQGPYIHCRWLLPKTYPESFGSRSVISLYQYHSNNNHSK